MERWWYSTMSMLALVFSHKTNSVWQNRIDKVVIREHPDIVKYIMPQEPEELYSKC